MYVAATLYDHIYCHNGINISFLVISATGRCGEYGGLFSVRKFFMNILCLFLRVRNALGYHRRLSEKLEI